nr:hypothetical protein Itr_chr14CG11990 [Ipomoea trifida]GMD83555.1 hypothetical protein Iba_chr14aCG6230 [Ipomoea batatas]GME11686.1 hypothetical protein Iba_scaffold12137CG0010 [Ipomoea batatas]
MKIIVFGEALSSGSNEEVELKQSWGFCKDDLVTGGLKNEFLENLGLDVYRFRDFDTDNDPIANGLRTWDEQMGDVEGEQNRAILNPRLESIEWLF